MKETNGKVLEIFIGECFMFRADDLLAPDLMEAHERYGIYIDDAVPKESNIVVKTNKILNACVRNAPLYGVKRRCIAEYDCSKCFDCSVFENCFLRECYTTYLYLNIRDTILNGIFSYECEKYRELLESGENEKIDSIRRLISNIDK